MANVIKWALGLLLMAVIAVIVSIVGILFISGENPADFARAVQARFALNGREADLEPVNAADTSPIRFEVVSGTGSTQIGQSLASAGLVRDTDLFVSYVRAEGIDGQLEAGTYFLSRAQSLPQIASALTDSRSSVVMFRVLEGWRAEEIAAAIDQNPRLTFSGADFLAAVSAGQGANPSFVSAVGLTPGDTLEGFLMPGSYELPPTITATGLVGTLTDAFIQQVGAQVINDAVAQGLTMRQAVTLASIVQREAVQPDEMDKIASVYRNRLDIGMKLDADPTVQYALNDTRGGWWPQITRADYTGVVSPFNTYLNDGLPPSPIANPGLRAITAAIYPETTGFYYFRADCRDDGYHDFAFTYEEHLANGC